MTYEGMVVAGGQDAGLAWESLVRGGLDGAERETVRKALLDYCGQDTLAMVRLLDKLRLLSLSPQASLPILQIPAPQALWNFHAQSANRD
jgi:hypothetical protein